MIPFGGTVLSRGISRHVLSCTCLMTLGVKHLVAQFGLTTKSTCWVRTDFTWTLGTSKRFGGASTPSNHSGYELHSLMACVAPKDYKM
jgi:hypothetical protein